MRLRSISAKLLLAAVLAVALPFLAFTVLVRDQMETRLSADVVEYFLKSKASDLADKIDLLVAEREKDLAIWSTSADAARLLRDPARDEATKRSLVDQLNHFGEVKGVYQVLLVADREGRVVATNTVYFHNPSLSPPWAGALRNRSVAEFDWFVRARRGETVREDWHVSPLTHEDPAAAPKHSSEYSVGFAAPIRDLAEEGEILGVWYSLMDWSFVQGEVLDRAKEYFRDLRGPQFYPSGYAFLWKADADTVIGHAEPRLYGMSVSSPPISLPQLTQAARAEKWGVFPRYEWPPGTGKCAAFKHCQGPEEGGFGWVVGIGINDEDIFRTAREFGAALTRTTVVWLGALLVATWFLSRAFVRPLRRLAEFTERVAAGDLSGRVEVGTRDEVGALAASFNRMTSEVASHRERVVRAEREAAWREMARQIAHEIKNPLTPMRLSTSLLQRAHREHPGDFDRVLERTTGTLLRQIDGLQKIASDFSAFAGGPRRSPRRLSLAEVAREFPEMYAGWAAERRVRFETSLAEAEVVADPEELRRLFINLLDNAFEAAGEGGGVRLEVARDGKSAILRVEDDGPGIPEEVRARLFEPYFSTKTTGTGLGLAICRRIVADLGGTIALEPRPGRGTSARVTIPLAADGPDREEGAT
ncbi:MAG: ATP-binding protein [Planctomycetes bacterium]|nr:ATP-binding protein [Planctomycetota bacterium]